MGVIVSGHAEPEQRRGLFFRRVAGAGHAELRGVGRFPRPEYGRAHASAAGRSRGGNRRSGPGGACRSRMHEKRGGRQKTEKGFTPTPFAFTEGGVMP